MALTTQQREQAWPAFVRNRAPAGTEGPSRWSKDEIRAGLDAATAWIEANQASYVASLSATAFAGANSTADEKLRLFLAALSARFGINMGWD